MQQDVQTKFVKGLPWLLGACGLLIMTSMLAFAVHLNRLDRPDESPVGEGVTVVVFERTSCKPCDAMREEIVRAFKRTELAEKATIRYFDFSDGQPPKRYKVASEIWTGPTTVVFDVYMREVSRLEGLPKSVEALENLIRPHVARAERELLRVASGKQ